MTWLPSCWYSPALHTAFLCSKTPASFFCFIVGQSWSKSSFWKLHAFESKIFPAIWQRQRTQKKDRSVSLPYASLPPQAKSSHTSALPSGNTWSILGAQPDDSRSILPLEMEKSHKKASADISWGTTFVGGHADLLHSEQLKNFQVNLGSSTIKKKLDKIKR